MFYAIPAPPAIVIQDDLGGVLADYAIQAGRWKAARQAVAINGTCASACTLYLATPNACVSTSAIVKLHAPFDNRNGHAVAWARDMMMQAYPAPLRRWIRQHGGLTADILTLEGRELTAMFPTCTTATAALPAPVSHERS